VKPGHRHFVSCSKWSSRFRDGHRTAYIPSGIHDDDLTILFNGGTLPGFEAPRTSALWPNCPCSYWCKSPVLQYVIYFLLWDKLLTHFLEFPHNGNGSQTKLIRRDCPASRTIYVPEDPTIRKACIVPNPENPHNHPILPPTKTPAMIKEIYKTCVRNAGIVGSSVRTVDNGVSPGLRIC